MEKYFAGINPAQKSCLHACLNRSYRLMSKSSQTILSPVLQPARDKAFLLLKSFDHISAKTLLSDKYPVKPKQFVKSEKVISADGSHETFHIVTDLKGFSYYLAEEYLSLFALPLEDLLLITDKYHRDSAEYFLLTQRLKYGV
jgi:hypothetical protein